MSRNDKLEQERHQLIKNLVEQFLSSTYEQQKIAAASQIAVTILRSRPLCRRFNGSPLTGVYQAIYLQAKEHLISHLNQQYALAQVGIKSDSKINLIGLSSAYLYQLQIKIFQEIIDDSWLKKMGLTAQNFEINSELRAYALTELIRAIKFSGRICRPHIQKFSPKLYQRLYEEAVNETLCYVCLNIDLYDPERGDRKFMNWVNFKLDKTILKCYEKYNRHAKFEIPDSENLDRAIQPTPAVDLTEILRTYIAQDPQGIFSATHIRNRPDANFTSISLAKFSGQSWENISLELDIPIGTLSSFYNRWCRRFAPLLDTELKQYL
ncbi:MAG: hypothetical protein AAFO95_10525 [Cyanobacteria bacterium J06600_6]